MCSSAWLLVFILRVLVASCLCNCLGVLLVFVDGPVEHVIVLEGLSDKQITEDLSQVRVVRLVIEAEGTGVVEIDGKFVGESTAQDLGGGSHLLLHDTVVLLFLGGSLQALPWERAAAEIEHDIAQGLHVITTRLFDTQMSIDGSVSSSTREVLVLSVGDMEVGLRVAVLLGQTKVNHVDLVASLADAHQEVVRLNITVDEGLGVDVLNSGNELVGQQEDGLEGEFAVAEVEQVFQTGTKKVENHGVVVTFCSEPANEWDSDTTGKGFVDPSFVFQLRVFGLDGLEFDGNLFTGDDVGAQIDVSETAATDLSSDTVLVTDTQILSHRQQMIHFMPLGCCSAGSDHDPALLSRLLKCKPVT